MNSGVTIWMPSALASSERAKMADGLRMLIGFQLFLFIMSPETDDFDYTLFLIDLIHDTMLYIQSSWIGSEKITDKFLVRRRILEWIFLQNLKQFQCVRLQSRRCKFFGILLSLLGIDKLPSHQSSFFEHSEISALRPSWIDSRMPVRDTRCNVSEIAFQSLSDNRTALPLLPFMTTGLCELTVWSISL